MELFLVEKIKRFVWAKGHGGRIVPSFVIFSPGLPNNAPPTVLPVFGPPSVVTTSSSMANSAQKVGTILPLYYHALSRSNHLIKGTTGDLK